MASVVSTLAELDGSSIVIVPIFDGEDFSDLRNSPLAADRAAMDIVCQDLVAARKYSITGPMRTESGRGILLVQAGSRRKLEPRMLMQIAASAARYLTARRMGDLAFLDRGDLSPYEFAYAVSLGSMRGAYDHMIRSTKGEHRIAVESISLLSTRDAEELEAGARWGQIVGESQRVARDLVNTPPNELTPTALGESARRIADEYGWQCDILDEDAMRELGMGTFLAVSSGSDEPARLIALRAGNPESPVKLALVGKGLTFDSGGLSLKTAEGMETMKGDMGGAAAVIGGLIAATRLGLDSISISGYIGATENMPGGHAMRPGDIVTAMNGKTVEILNTDAEGRLVLADVLTYAESQGATHIVDFATLTGGAIVALGYSASVVTGQPLEWGAEVTAVANEALDLAWQMPLFQEYRIDMESEVADIKNISGARAASALTAAAFLSDFVGNAQWAHMDIAGTAWAPKSKPYAPEGGTGVGVGTIAGIIAALSRQATSGGSGDITEAYYDSADRHISPGRARSDSRQISLHGKRRSLGRRSKERSLSSLWGVQRGKLRMAARGAARLKG